MKPRIDIDIRDYEGKTAELCDISTFEPYEVYVNNERVCTSERVEELEDENARLRELVRDMFEVIDGAGFDPYVERQGKRGPYYEEDPSWRVKIRERVRELGVEDYDD